MPPKSKAKKRGKSVTKCPTSETTSENNILESEKDKSLDESLKFVVSNVQRLESRLDEAIEIQTKLDSLLSSDEYRNNEEYQRIEAEFSETIQHVAAANKIDSGISDRKEKILILHEEIKMLQSLPGFMPKEILLQLRNEAASREMELAKACQIKCEINRLKSNSAYLEEKEQASIRNVLQKTREALSPIQETKKNNNISIEKELTTMLKVHDKVKRELECSICLEIPAKDTNVFSCQSCHLICFNCKSRKLSSCPVCKMDFTKIPPMRNLLAEKMIANLD